MDNSGEVELLEALRDDIIAHMPADALPKLRQELAASLRDEDYERAAAVRDRIAAVDDNATHPAA